MNSIYALIDPCTGLVRYVGITAQPLAKRFSKHLQMARRGEQNHRSAWIRSLLAQNKVPLMLLIETCSERDRERFWISHYRSAGINLTNGTNGGDGVIDPSESIRKKISASVTGYKHTPDARAKIAEASQRMWQDPVTRSLIVSKNTGQVRSLESRQKMSAAQMGHQKRLGQHCTEDHKRKLSESNRGKKRSPETCQRISEIKKREWATRKQHRELDM